MSAQYYEGIGRRKSASARVRLFPGGTGSFIVNDKEALDYFDRFGDVEIMLEPLRAIGQDKHFNITVHVQGGGVSGQRDAVQLGIARALVKLDPDMKPQLKDGKFLTRDPRVKERKKPGLLRARKAPTYTKR
jgi:small subunit ribosomal protein S9